MDAKFFIGQVVHHALFDYRGVVIDVDPEFMLTDGWYELMAKSKPPKNRPWYRVLVHNSNHETYVAEQNLTPDSTGEAIQHPEIDLYFDEFSAGVYQLIKKSRN